MEKARVGFVAFSYPEYPSELVHRFIRESEKVIRDLDIEVVSANPVVVYKDVSSAVKLLRKEDVDCIVALIVSWLEAPNAIAVLKEFFNKPVLLWSHTMFKERDEWLTMGPIPAAGVLRETLEEMGANFKFIWGMPGEEGVRNHIKLFTRAAHGVRSLAKSKIGLLGYASMGMYTGTFNHVSVSCE